MAGQDLPYFKFVQELIDAGIWARMSAAARTLYPVLLRFSDRHFSPVYPGSNRLLQLTGFKQKSSLRKAREELARLGLISIATGSGRSNSVYHFRFEWATATPRGAMPTPPGEQLQRPLGGTRDSGEGRGGASPYNQIHISINNTQKEGATGGDWRPMEERYGAEAVRLVRSELSLAGLPAHPEDVEKILSGRSQSAGLSWEEIRLFLRERISPGSLETLEQALVCQERDLLVFKSNLPEHLKHLLGRIAPNACFELEPALRHREIWKQAGTDG